MSQCTARAKRTGDRCQKHAVAGAVVCRSHGAGARQVRRKAHQRVAEAKALAELLSAEIEPIDNPLVELAKLGGKAKQWMDIIETRVAQLARVGYSGPVGEQINAEVTLLERAMDRLASILIAFAKLNIDERLARIDERIADQVILGLSRALDDNDVTGADAANIVASTAQHLRLIESGDAA